MKSILISTSRLGTAIPDYFKYLGEEFTNNNFSVIFIFDGRVKNLPPNEKNIKYFTYPNQRPTQLKDFIFLSKIIKKEKPVLCISNFGSTNIVSIASYVFRVPNRINYLHTSPNQLRIDSKQNSLYDWFLKQRKILILKINTHVITNSNEMSKLITRFFKLKKRDISVMPYLIENSTTVKQNFKAREKKICIVGRLSPSKGHKDLLYSFAKCKEVHQSLELIIVGGGPERKRLEKLSESLNIKKNITFLGPLPNKDVGKIFSKCLVSISASRSEAFGIVNIESLKEGTPILSTATEGARDILKEGENGYIINLGQKNDLSEKLSVILNNWDYFSKNALETFENNFSKKNIKSHFKKYINDILVK